MNIKPIILYWIKISDYDIESAENLFQNKKYVNSLFFCHLSIEKILKALYVKIKENNPPKTHNLLHLSKQCDLNLSERKKFFLSELNKFNLDARYPDYKLQIFKLATKKFTKNYINNSKKFQLWIKKKL